MVATSVSGTSFSSSGGSSKSKVIKTARPGEGEDAEGRDEILDNKSSLEYGIFGVLYTLSKEKSETRIRARWVILKIALDAWQLYTTVISPTKQGWSLEAEGISAWSIINFTWLGDQGYGAYLLVLYSMVGFLALNIGLCVWVAWCFKEHKFPVVWPIKVLRLFSSIFFQAFDVASLNLLQLGISCRFTGPEEPHLHLSLFPKYSCSSAPHLPHAVVSALSMGLFVAIAMLLNMAEVEVNPLSRRPMALGHSGSEVMCFAIKALMTLVDVFIGWRRVAACIYLALSLALAWQTLRWSPHLVAWVNYLKSGVSVAIVWCCITLIVLVFPPAGLESSFMEKWSDYVTIIMLAGLAPAFGLGVLTSRVLIRHMTKKATKAMEDAMDAPTKEAFSYFDEPRDIEIVARCCRVWRTPRALDPTAVKRANHLIRVGLEIFPNSAYMVLLHANFMIDVLGVSQSGSRRIEDARKLNPSLLCRFIMFIRQQEATQNAAGNSVNSSATMDLLGYVEYQRKQRMVVRLHRDALQAMCSFWKALDTSRVSFKDLSRALSKIESSVSQAQTAYHIVLEYYGNNAKLVHLYAKFLQTVKNDPWRASEYFAEAERLAELKSNDASGPLLPDGTPLGRMDDLDTSVVLLNAVGEIQMANKQTCMLFGYKRGALEGKPLSSLLAPHNNLRLAEELAHLSTVSSLKASLSSESSGGTESRGPHGADEYRPPWDAVVVGVHCDRLAFPISLSLRKVSGVGEDSTIVALIEPMPVSPDRSSLWVTAAGIVTTCDPQFVTNFGWRPTEVIGASVTALVKLQDQSVSRRSLMRPSLAKAGGDTEVALSGRAVGRRMPAVSFMSRLLAHTTPAVEAATEPQSLLCWVDHKYERGPVPCRISLCSSNDVDGGKTPVYEIHIRLLSSPTSILAVDRKGIIKHASYEVAATLVDNHEDATQGRRASFGGLQGQRSLKLTAEGGNSCDNSGDDIPFSPTLPSEAMIGYTLFDFLPPPWKDMHVKFLKDITVGSPPSLGAWSCRKNGQEGSTLELRSIRGHPIYRRVSLSTTEISGEVVHVIQMTRSSLDDALAERRLRLRLSLAGEIAAVESGDPKQLFGLDSAQLVRRGLWEVLGELPNVKGRGPHVVAALVERALAAGPGHSCRVSVVPPARAIRMPSAQKEGILALTSLTAAVLQDAISAKPAVIQVFFVVPESNSSHEAEPQIYVELWPMAAVSGLLQLDSHGRVAAVLEESTRPVGLLFGLPSEALVGCQLGEVVMLPPGRSHPRDLLSLHGTKKSSLKTNTKDVNVKTGPVYMLQAVHTDNMPLNLDVQIMGKPVNNEPSIAILRFHLRPVIPSRNNVTEAVISQPRLPITVKRPTTAVAVTAAVESKKAGAIVDDAAATQSPFLMGDNTERGSPSSRHVVPPTGTPEAPSRQAGQAGGILNHLQEAGDGDGMSLPGEAPIGKLRELPSPSNLLAAGLQNGLPVPGVTMSGKATAALLAGRSKLSELVRAMDSGGLKASLPSPLSAVALPVPVDDVEPINAQDGTDGDEAAESNHSSLHPPVEATYRQSSDRVRDWVTSEGAFFQNSADGVMEMPADDMSDVDMPARILSMRPVKFTRGAVADLENNAYGDNGSMQDGEQMEKPDQPSNSNVGQKAVESYGVSPPLQDDFDAESEGGQSAVSGAQSMGGTEYTRGKRFRKLTKLMDSSQAHKVQQRLRLHALAIVAALAVVHIVCFVLTITAINTQREAMLKLGRSGQSMMLMHRILTDVRSLDIITDNSSSLPQDKTVLYSMDDLPYFVNRVSKDADEVKTRINEILSTNTKSDLSPIVALFYSTQRLVWEGHEADGSDKWSNITIWDFATRFYTMSKNIEQYHQDWLNDSTRFGITVPGEFLLRSGPELFRDLKEILNLLLYIAVDNARWVDTLQVAFLVVEGTAISFIAACYLMFLVRSVATQRYKLYGTFLMIPVGLTRALASQNTNLLLDEEEDDDEDDDEDKPAPETVDEAIMEVATPNTKRRAMLRVRRGSGVDDVPVSFGHQKSLRHQQNVPGSSFTTLQAGAGGDAEDIERKAMYDKYDHTRHRSLTGDITDISGRGCWAWLRSHLTIASVLPRRSRSVIVPIPQSQQHGSNGGVLSMGNSNSRRTLKCDSNETTYMLLPFAVWSILVVTLYAFAVVKMQGVVEVVAIHSVVNFMSARTYRTVFFCQEQANTLDPKLLPERRAALFETMRSTKDAWYTLQLGKDAYLAAGPNTEKFPMVKSGMSHSSPKLEALFYGSGTCHRIGDNLPCPGPEYRFYQVSHTGVDSMMSQFIISVTAMSTNKSMIPEGLTDEHFDFAYNVGAKDLMDGVLEISQAHYETIVSLFSGIMVLHVILFLLFWFIFTGFLIFLLNPLLQRVTRERRRIAELMSQLPLELDVEKLVAKALGATTGATVTSSNTASQFVLSSPNQQDQSVSNGAAFMNGGVAQSNSSATMKWKAIIRASALVGGKGSATGSLVTNGRPRRSSLSGPRVL